MEKTDTVFDALNAADDKKAEKKSLSAFVEDPERKPGEIAFSCMWILFGALGYYFALGMTHDDYASPSVFPKLASCIIVLCGLFILFKDLKRNKPKEGSPNVFQYLLPKDVLVILCGLIVYCIVLPRLHFIASSYLFMVLGMIYLHRGKKIVQSLIISAGALAVLVAIFRYIFLVILP
ncbi:MAG: tripartite tricarboxylate transporter TctB family protein [Synergistaceae bacterium]